MTEEYWYEMSDGHTTMKGYVRASNEQDARDVAISVNNWNKDSVKEFAAVPKSEHDLLD